MQPIRLCLQPRASRPAHATSQQPRYPWRPTCRPQPGAAAILHLHQSNRVERLADELAALLATPAAGSPLLPETVMVQSAGMGRWLQLALAERLGVCANVEFPFPAAFVWRLLRTTLPELPETSTFEPDVLAWRLLRLVEDVPAAGAEWAPLRDWLAGTDARGRLDLARRLAVTFDRYLVYRPDWI